MTAERKEKIMREFADEMNAADEAVANNMLAFIEAYARGIRDARKMHAEKEMKATA